MKIYLIRHGRQCSKLCNVNVDLAREGYKQAELVGKRLANAHIDMLYSSDYDRAVQTAQTANRYWNVDHKIFPELREIDFGQIQGLSDAEMVEKFADFKAKQQEMIYDLHYPGGECARDVVERVLPVLKLIARQPYEHVAVVTHGGVIRSLVAYLLGMDLAKVRLLGNSLENCGITELHYHPKQERFTVERFNDYAHLEPYPELLRGAWVQAEN